ncbi:MAG: hypothetical protein E7603_09700 [Ruminococcaceae bacterium]|nr:hypothetical protein [Oscillospiraceae bacterium]
MELGRQTHKQKWISFPIFGKKNSDGDSVGVKHVYFNVSSMEQEMIVYRYLSLRRHRQATLLCSATSLVRGRQFKAPSVHYATQNVGRLSAKLS